jgi:hypothetical protein
MAKHSRHPLSLILLSSLLSYIAVVVVDSAQPESYSLRGRYPFSHYPHLQNFPNEKLYQAYLVIQRFKNTISCDPRNITSTWSGHDICSETDYLGFHCATPPQGSRNPTVTSVIFSGFGLCAPKLLGFIDQLPDLALIEATSNKFGGQVPILTAVSYLYTINIETAQLQINDDYGVGASHISGGCFGKFCVFLSFVQSNRRIAEGDSGFTNAKALLLNNNILSGPIPNNIGFSKLSYLALANNKLTGSIPSSIAHAQDTLLEVLLLNNQLSGCLPHELGMLTKAAVIDAGMNQLTGPIPASFSCLSNVEQLNLAGNRLYGDIPEAVCKLARPSGRLVNLTLSSNYFTSVGAACETLIKQGVLDVKNNCIPGYINQRRPAECLSFLSQPHKMCSSGNTHVSCPAAAAKTVVTYQNRKRRDYYAYLTYATLYA